MADSEGLRTQLFNDSKRAQQRQEVKKKQEQIKQEEAKKKAEEIKKAKLAAEQAKTTESRWLQFCSFIFFLKMAMSF